jgi:hypothetical protein
MKSAAGNILCILAVLGCVSGLVQAQSVSNSQINGTVQDATGLAVAGAQVVATQTDTGVVRSATTGADGSYALPNLPIGPYRLEISKEGFSKYIQSGITLQVDSNPSIEAVLKVGSVTEQVEVHADAAMVETRATGIGQVIDNQRVLELPLNGRQATDLVFLAGAATVGNSANLNSGVRNYPTVQITVAGGLDYGVSYLLDGGTLNDPYNNLNLPLPFPDALQEFKVETSALPAQYGHHGSAAVNAVTKSGTNEFHGDAFEFLRNGDLNARNAFALTRDSLKRNQFGGTIGGPVLKNKIFFFAGEQSTTKRSNPTTSIAFIPTAQMVAGDFTAVASAACNTTGKAITLPASSGFIDNQIAPSLLSAPALKLVSLLPATANPCGRIQYGGVQNSNEHIGIARGDYQATSKQSLFARYQLAWLDQPTDYDGANALTLTQAALAARVHEAVVGHTWVLGANMVSSFRAALNRSQVPKVSPKLFDLSELGVNMFVYQPNVLTLSVTNGFSVGGTSAVTSIYDTTSFQFTEDFSLIRGAHQMGFGADFVNAQLNASSFVNAVGPTTFNGQVTGLGLADFMIGKPATFAQSVPTSLYYRLNYVGLYAQDTWKATPRLTLNYGIRWDPFIPEYFKSGALAHFDPAAFSQGIHSAIYLNAPSGLTFPGDPGYPGNSVANEQLAHFAPRVGLAWDPRGNGSMSIRASYGMFYNTPTLGNYSGFAQIPPFGNSVTVNSPASFANPWASQPGGNPFPLYLSPTIKFPVSGNYVDFSLNPKLTYQNQWNLSIQKQIGADWLVGVNYLGSNVIHLWGGSQINPGVFIPGTCGTTACSTTANLNSRRVLSQQNPAQGAAYGSVAFQDDGGTSTYHGMLLSVQRRRAHGLTVQGNYTWSHCIGDLGNTSLGVAGTNFEDPGNRHSSRGDCGSSDVRHLFNLSTVYEAPRFSHALLRRLASSWQLSGIARVQSGTTVNVTTGVDGALSGQSAERPNLVLADPYAPNKSAGLWLNPAAFAAPPAGAYGNLGFDRLRGPGWVRIDLGLVRAFPIREKLALQFRFEAFNFLNKTNLDNPIAATNSPNLGRILTAEDPRILQAAVKITF